MFCSKLICVFEILLLSVVFLYIFGGGVIPVLSSKLISTSDAVTYIV
jgi:hypothetical protein